MPQSRDQTPGTAALTDRLARLEAALVAIRPALGGVGRRYRIRLRWALAQPPIHHDRLAAGLFGANGRGPAIEACIRDLRRLADMFPPS